MSSVPPIVICSDIDAVLTASSAASYAAAARTLDGLAADDVAVVLCSGRTRSQLERVCQELGWRHPFVTEHGGGAFVPEGYFPFEVPDARQVPGYQVVEYGRPYAEVVATLRTCAAQLGIRLRTFSEMSVEEVADECRIPLLDARLAKLREYEELFRIAGHTPQLRDRLLKLLRGVHLRCVAGEQFDRLGAPVELSLGAGCLLNLYRRAYGAVTTVTIVDTAGDRDLLSLAQHRVVLESRNGSRRDDGSAHQTATALNVAAWADAVVTVVRTLRGSRSSDLRMGAIEPRTAV